MTTLRANPAEARRRIAARREDPAGARRRIPAFRVTIPLERVDESFRALGSTIRVAIAAPAARGMLARSRAELREFEACASRFRPGSELCRLNADPRESVPVSPLLRAAIEAALWAASESGGLVDPTLLDELEAAGYTRSLAPVNVARGAARPGDAALTASCAVNAAAAARDVARAALPHPAARWRGVRIDRERGTIERPAGLRLDLGGSGKGFAADRVAAILRSAPEWLIDAGGDLRVGGEREVRVAHPLREEPAAVLQVADAAVATSSIVRRAWRDGHHLLDPATGRPAFTGLLSVTALAPTTLHAETLAKAALLSGPAAARTILAARGGVMVHDGGEVELA